MTASKQYIAGKKTGSLPFGHVRYVNGKHDIWQDDIDFVLLGFLSFLNFLQLCSEKHITKTEP